MYNRKGNCHPRTSSCRDAGHVFTHCRLIDRTEGVPATVPQHPRQVEGVKQGRDLFHSGMWIIEKGCRNVQEHLNRGDQACRQS